MSPLREIVQSNFSKGIVPTTGKFAQPKGILKDISNLLYTKRGALVTRDGDSIIASLNGEGASSGLGQILDICEYSPVGGLTELLFLQQGPVLATPTGLAVALASGGSLVSGTTYYWKVTAIGGGGETLASTEVSATPSGSDLTANLTWTPVSGASSYNVYRSTSSGNEVLLGGVGLPTTSASYSDNGSAAPVATSYSVLSGSATGYDHDGPDGPVKYTSFNYVLGSNTGLSTTANVTVTGNTNSALNRSLTGAVISGNNVSCTIANAVINASGTGGMMSISGAGGISPPTEATAGSTYWVEIPTGSMAYTIPGNVIATLPGVSFPALGNVTGGSSPGTAIAPAARGKLIQFAGEQIALLANTTPPQQYLKGTGVSVLNNTFVVAYPTWTATTAYLVGDQIQPATPNGYSYTCTQQGVSGSTAPTFPLGLNSTVQDGTVIWQNSGVTSVIAPRGGAYGIVHEGALWLWNTQPAQTSDNLDGPCVLKQSDVQTPNSWNPLNTAVVDKDDGDQGTGIASFTIAEFGIAPTGSLVLFKTHKTYQVTGVFGASDFAIQQAKTEMGCVASASIFFISGVGLVRLTHLGFAAFDGVGDQLVSEEIRPFIFGGDPEIVPVDWSYAYLSSACGNAVPPAYCCAVPTIGSNGGLNRILFLDTVLRAWTIIDLPFSIGCLHQVIAGGTTPITVMGGQSDGTLRRIQAGDSSSTVSWFAETPEVFEAGGTRNDYVRRILIRGSFPSVGSGSITEVSFVSLDVPFPCKFRQVPNPFSSLNFEIDVTVHRRGSNVRAIVSGIGGIEIDSIVWHVEAGKVGQLVSYK